MEFEVFNSQNRLCCQSDNFEYLCDKCKGTVAATQRQLANDPYAAGIAALRSAGGISAPPDDSDQQLRAMAAFRQSFYDMTSTMRIAAESPATGREYSEPPDPYEAALEQMRKETR